MWTRFRLYFDTVRYLKTVQIIYRIYYVFRGYLRKIRGFSYQKSIKTPTNLYCTPLQLAPSISSFQSYYSSNKFRFLNLTHQFDKTIDWEYSQYGKLWTYNLNYFEFLLQDNICKDEGIAIIKNYITLLPILKTAYEPYTISLRLIFWIRFLIKYDVQDTEINHSIYFQTQVLIDNIEWHLLGNHLLENAFGLFFASYYLNNSQVYEKATSILKRELEEQILADGAHFELSPMYHNIMLYRLLDVYNLIQSNITHHLYDKTLSIYIAKRIETMLYWQKNVTFADGTSPNFNDSSINIAPNTNKIIDYARRLGINNNQNTILGASGYRKFESDTYELFFDVGAIGPNYIPGHAHSDTFNFVMNILGKRFIVDVGISTYEKNALRQYERSTAAHNT
jgi:Heparinase II/III-like protein/Heparinase II/III N-terminus